MRQRRTVLLLAALLFGACNRTTGTLNEENQKRFEAEGVLHKAVDVVFRRTKLGDGTRTHWEDGDASIVVTRESVVIHSGDRFLLEITPRSTGEYKVSREKDRVTIQGGRGQSRVSWSFRPPDDPEAWTQDVRAVIRNAAQNRSKPHETSDATNSLPLHSAVRMPAHNARGCRSFVLRHLASNGAARIR